MPKLSEEKRIALASYKRELLDYAAIKDPIEKSVILKEIIAAYASTLGVSAKEIELHTLIESSPEGTDSDKKTGWDLSEILDLEEKMDSWISPNLIRAGGGLVLVTAAPKVGKTLVAGYNLAYGITVSGEFLGAPCMRGRVLLYQSEEGILTVKRRLVSRGIEMWNQLAHNAIKTNAIRVERKFAITDVATLRRDIAKHKPDIVIFDSLRGISANSGISENSPEISQPIYLLQRVLQHEGVTGILIHHSKKNCKGDSLEDASGHLSIGGANDGGISLSLVPNSDERIISLRTFPREGSPVNYHIKRTHDKDTGYWGFQKLYEVGVDPIVVKIEKKILRFLSKKVNDSPGSSYSKDEINTFLSMSDIEDSLDLALERLAESCQISESKVKDEVRKAGFKLVYSVPENSPWLNFGDNQHPEYDEAEKLTACKTKAQIDLLRKQWSKDYPEKFDNKVWGCLSLPEQERLLEIANPFKFIVGDRVIYNGVSVKDKVNKGSTYTVEAVLANVAKGSWFYEFEGVLGQYSQSDLLEVKLVLEGVA